MANANAIECTRSELLANEVAQQIREKIQNQEYKANEHLTVRRLCDEFGTSETPVKQALNQLVATGLVVATPKCGMRVRSFDFQNLKDTWEARMMIELYCAPSAVEMVRRSEDFVKKIQELLAVSNREYDRCIENYTQETFNATHEHDRAFHTVLVESCENDQIIRMYKDLNTHAGMFTGYMCHTKETLQEVKSQHAQIADCLFLCDVEGLKKAIQKHIYATIQVYRKTRD